METGDPCDKFEESAGESLVEMLHNCRQLALDIDNKAASENSENAEELYSTLTKVIAAIEEPSE